MRLRWCLFSAGLLCAVLSGLTGYWALLLVPAEGYSDVLLAGAFAVICWQSGLMAREVFTLALDPNLERR